MLKLENVGLTLGTDEGQVRILEDINLHLEKGKMYALTGPNGSGKSSVARAVMGIVPPTRGKVVFKGRDITGLGITERSRLGIGYSFQHPPRFKGMRVKDILEIAAGDSKRADCRVLRKIGLCPEDYLERPLDGSLSGGEFKRIEIATLLAREPILRIFDEPEAGIDLWSFEQLIDVIGQSHLPGTTTVIISHQEKILNMVDEIILIIDGTVKMKGDKKTIWPRIKDIAGCACRRNCAREDEPYADCPR